MDPEEINFYKHVEKITEKDPRYKSDAYEFLMQALFYTQKKLKRKGHVSGRELSEGIREFALEQYGPMVKTVFGHWGIKKTDDFGEIVFNMVDNELLGRTEEDSRNDFKDIYDFDEVFTMKHCPDSDKGKVDLS